MSFHYDCLQRLFPLSLAFPGIHPAGHCQLNTNIFIKKGPFISRGHNMNTSCRVQGGYQGVRSLRRNSRMWESNERDEDGWVGTEDCNVYFTLISKSKPGLWLLSSSTFCCPANIQGSAQFRYLHHECFVG